MCVGRLYVYVFDNGGAIKNRSPKVYFELDLCNTSKRFVVFFFNGQLVDFDSEIKGVNVYITEGDGTTEQSWEFFWCQRGYRIGED